METKLEFFKKYCKVKELENVYAFGKVEGDIKTLVFLNGETSAHIEYKGENLRDGKLYKTSEATCGGLCSIGKPKESCIGRCYSENKCSVYYLKSVDLENFKYEIDFEEFGMLTTNS